MKANKKVKMRELGNADIYLLSEISDKMNMQLPDMPEITDWETKEANLEVEKYGKQLIKMFLHNMYKAKDEVNSLLASVSGKTVKEIESMSAYDTNKLVLEMIGKTVFWDFFG